MLAERTSGQWRWPGVHFAAALFGSLGSVLGLNPIGAGNSMSVAGLLPVVDTLLPDNHGAPLLLGRLLPRR